MRSYREDKRVPSETGCTVQAGELLFRDRIVSGVSLRGWEERDLLPSTGHSPTFRLDLYRVPDHNCLRNSRGQQSFTQTSLSRDSPVVLPTSKRRVRTTVGVSVDPLPIPVITSKECQSEPRVYHDSYHLQIFYDGPICFPFEGG